MAWLARSIYLRAGTLIGVAAVLALVAAVLAHDIFERVDPFDIGDPGSETARADRKFERATGRSPEPGVILLVSGRAADRRSRDLAASLKGLRAIPGIAKVQSPRSDPALDSDDGEQALILGYLARGAERVDIGEAVFDRFESVPGVLPGGTAVAAYQLGVKSESDTRRLELYAAPILLLLLLVVFRTVVAATLPLVVAGLSILFTFAALRLITEVGSIDLFALTTVTGLGVGLALDYSLFILDRYRSELHPGTAYEHALKRTMQTAGRTVAFSALTVATALGSLIVFPQPFLQSTGIAGALVAVFAGITALIVLPAIVAVLGPSIHQFATRRAPSRSRRSPFAGFWLRLPRAVCKRPLAAALISTVAVSILASQAFGIELTTPNARELPAGESARDVVDSIEELPGLPATQLFALLPASAVGDVELRDRITAVPSVDSADPVRPLGDDVAVLRFASSVDPLSRQGEQLVSDSRHQLGTALLGGGAAEQVDQRASILDHAPLALGILILTNLLVLLVMTRSVLLPVLALAVNLLSVTAALGLLQIAFTTERIANVLGTDAQDGIDMSVPVIAFAVGFGLSTDYGIFLFERVREERRHRGSEEEAIVAAVSSTGRLISASAVLLAVAVGAFVFSDLVIVKEFAVAISLIVLLDATVVRGLLIPAVLRLLGSLAWLGPRRIGGGTLPAPRDPT